MQIYPAIDLKGGKCVRLVQGDFDRESVYNDDPVAAAMSFVNAGASYIHVVDLDGARSGNAVNGGAIAGIVKYSSLPVQTGGGIRSIDDIEQKLKIGVSRVIIGTAAVKDPSFIKEAVRLFGDKIAVGIDAANGIAVTDGWYEKSGVSAVELGKQMAGFGVKTVIYTDISKDGMLCGPNIAATDEMIKEVNCDIIASGGISNMGDIEAVYKIGSAGVIIGKALYAGILDLRKIVEIYEHTNKE